MKKGYIYILINPSLEKDLLKIGKTTTTSEERAAEISSSTGVATAYYVAYEAKTSDCHLAEAVIHKELAEYRYKSNREFFKIPLKKAIPLLEQILSEMIEPSEEKISKERNDSDYKRAEALNDSGVIEHNAGNYTKAIDLYNKAISIKPDSWEYHANLEATYYMIGHNEEAEKAIKKALILNPRSAVSLNILGAIFHDAGLYDEAIKVLKESLNIDPNQSLTHNTLGGIYYAQKRYENSITALKEALRLSPGDPQVHFNLGVCYCQSDKPNDAAAQKHYEVLLKLDQRKAHELGDIMRGGNILGY